MKKEITYCDICGTETPIETKPIQVVFTTEQTEGRSCKPHFTMEKIDICAECQSLRLKGNQLFGAGAQGFNRYEFKQLKAINIILDETEPQSPLFVEIETDDGKGIGIGERIAHDGLIRLRITADDLTL